MRNFSLILLLSISFLALLSGVAGASPILSFSLNANEVIAGTSAGNQVITATCLASETCNIIATNGLVLATGTTTATLNLNSITPGTNGYFSFIAQNSIGTNSVTNTVRVITVTNSTSMTFNNIQPVAYKTGTTMQFVLTSLAFKPFETYCSNNNMVIYNTQGIVQTFWQQGNQINESNPNLCGAAEDIILIKSPAGFLPAKSSNTLNIGWAAPGINLLDGNYICEAPQLSIPNGAYDCGSKIFADYWSGGQGSNTIGTAFTNNGMNATAIYNPAKNLTGVCGRWQG